MTVQSTAMLRSIIMLAMQAAPVPTTLPRLQLLPPERGCDARVETSEDVVVCARNDARFRLSVPGGSSATFRDGPVRGEAPRASIDGAVPCGIFAGERACGQAEAARYGYGGGRDPVTVGTKALRKLFDPDAELGGPTPVPRGAR